MRYLNAVGGGKVTKIDDKIAYVEEPDGFETPVLIRECVVVDPDGGIVPKKKFGSNEPSKYEAPAVAKPQPRPQVSENNVPVVALVGYTNVGKSSLLNALCGEQIFEADMLFATLDPTARKLVLPSGLQIILVDTVGFVSRLPHHLVEAFKSTLEEAAFADVIIKVADAGDAQAAEQLAVTDEVLGSLDCEGIPQLVVYNKCDVANAVAFDPDILLTSAKTGYGLDALLAKIDEVLNHRVRTIEVVLPYDKLALADILRSRGSVAEEEYREEGVFYRATVKIDDLHRFEEYLL